MSGRMRGRRPPQRRQALARDSVWWKLFFVEPSSGPPSVDRCAPFLAPPRGSRPKSVSGTPAKSMFKPRVFTLHHPIKHTLAHQRAQRWSCSPLVAAATAVPFPVFTHTLQLFWALMRRLSQPPRQWWLAIKPIVYANKEQPSRKSAQFLIPRLAKKSTASGSCT